jgi:hypothetical protein
MLFTNPSGAKGFQVFRSPLAPGVQKNVRDKPGRYENQWNPEGFRYTIL